MQHAEGAFEVADDDVVWTWLWFWNSGLFHEEKCEVHILELLLRRRDLQMELVKWNEVAFQQAHQQDEKHSVLNNHI